MLVRKTTHDAWRRVFARSGRSCRDRRSLRSFTRDLSDAPFIESNAAALVQYTKRGRSRAALQAHHATMNNSRSALTQTGGSAEAGGMHR